MQPETHFITEGAPLPTEFELTVTGLRCGDAAPAPGSIQYQILDAEGQPAADPPVAGLYEVIPTLNDPDGQYADYAIESLMGKLYVSPLVDCEDKIVARIVCRQPVSLPDEPRIKYLYRYQYTNKLSVPIYMAHGPGNRYLTAAYYLGEPPEIFEPGTHTFDVYVDDSFFLWKIKSPGCREFSKGHSGDFAGPCEEANNSALTIDADSEIPASLSVEAGDRSMKLFPNPARSQVWLSTPKTAGQLGIEIFDARGRRLFQQAQYNNGLSQLELDLSGYPTGLLLIRTTFDGRQQVWRLVKE
jgi:hypothetical protein